jgi:hypothetical protein
VESFPINLKAIVPSSSGLPPLYTSLYIPPFLAPVQRGGGENGETQRHAFLFYNNFKAEFEKPECFKWQL